MFLGRETAQRLEAACMVVGIQEETEVCAEPIVAVVMVALDRRVLARSVHPLDLPVRPRVVRLRQAMLDAVLSTDTVEHMPAAKGCRT